MDSAIQVFEKFNDILEERIFTCFENEHTIVAWIFGSEKGNAIFKEFMEYYHKIQFIPVK